MNAEEATEASTVLSGTVAQRAPPPAPLPKPTSIPPRPSSGPPKALALAQRLQEARRLLEAHGETTLSIAGIKAQMRRRLSATLQMPKESESSQYTTTHLELFPARLMRPWLLSMGWVEPKESTQRVMIFETNSNKVLAQLYQLDVKGVSIQASKLHRPKSSKQAASMMAAVAPGRITLYLRDDKSEYGSVVTNIATINEVRTPPFTLSHVASASSSPGWGLFLLRLSHPMIVCVLPSLIPWSFCVLCFRRVQSR